MTVGLIKISAKAPMPLMVPSAAAAFEKLRVAVAESTGRDFLARLADCYRPPDFTSSKKGVANRSWHKTGRAFDYDQTAPYLVIAKEPIRGAMYFRTWIRCTTKKCERVTVSDYRGYSVTDYMFDFTKSAADCGWERIPAWRGWQRHYNLMEFWHYQFTERLTLDEALHNVKKHNSTFLRFGSKGDAVKEMQRKLSVAGYLLPAECDGIFGKKTREAVVAFQRFYGLEPDGIVGPKTLNTLDAVHTRTN